MRGVGEVRNEVESREVDGRVERGLGAQSKREAYEMSSSTGRCGRVNLLFVGVNRALCAL